MSDFEGGCRCGKVRFKAAGDPKFVANCHCEDCRRSTGGAFSTWIGFETGQVSWPNPPDLHESSPATARGFCAVCGTPVSFSSEKWAGETHFLIGTFDNPDQFTPTGDAFAAEKLPWVTLIEER